MFFNNRLYMEEISLFAQGEHIHWDSFFGRSVLITGATGLIGKFLVDLIMYMNQVHDANIAVYAMGRSRNNAKIRFRSHLNEKLFKFIEQDVNNPITFGERADFVIHAASNTHPIAYATDPISTITTNILGTKNVLEYAVEKDVQRVMFLSTVEVYGQNRGDVEAFDESYLGYLNCNTLRAGYPEAKRAGESMCQAYLSKHDVNIVIPRLCRVYGPTMQDSDSKVLAQFLKKAIDRENIILKSDGTQHYSFLYVGDAVTAILKLLVHGEKGEAYNVSDVSCDVTLRTVAELLASLAQTEVVFELPNEVERKGFSTATKAVLDSTKLRSLGWVANYGMREGLVRTISILREQTKLDGISV